MKTLIRFLGGVHLALFLIVCSALLVTAATFLESSTGSHLWAEKLIYKSPLFKALLALYFINILVSALRRYPFQRRHIPFLITHLGLLMIISGVFVKMVFGVQGTMTIVEGTASSELVLPNTLALEVSSPDGERTYYPLESFNLIELYPHHERTVQTFIIDDQVRLAGLEPLPLSHQGLEVELEGETWLIRPSPTPEIDRSETGRVLWVAKNGDKAELIATLGGEEIFRESFGGAMPESLVMYAGGFRGYAVEARFPSQKEFLSTFLKGEPSKADLFVESPLAVTYRAAAPKTKLEENRPLARLNFEGKEIALGYDPDENGLLWPVRGDKALRLTTNRIFLPHRVRIHRAETAYYPGTADPSSYSCVATIDGTKVLLEMNAVHETEDGTRFYLAGIAGEGERSARRVHLVVNRDPAKRTLTYPGAFLVALGILGLFWGRR
ncbi:MAG: hypothetical protein KDK48_05165 [Chlamydiia bacterium]|nr:hypothetical protein [Chlamydiia bacterium]